MMLRTLLLIAAALGLSAVPVQAQSLLFYPAGEWSYAENAGKCSLGVVFNNGYRFTLMGADGAVSGFDLDVRQTAFEIGQDYDVNIGIDDSLGVFTQGSAKEAQLLYVDVSGDPEFFSVLSRASDMDLTIESNAFRFNLAGMSASARDFETCVKSPPVKSSPVKSLPEMAEVPAPRKRCPNLRKRRPNLRKQCLLQRKRCPNLRKRCPNLRKRRPNLRKRCLLQRKRCPNLRKRCPSLRIRQTRQLPC